MAPDLTRSDLDYVKLIAQEAGKSAAQEAIAWHEGHCPIKPELEKVRTTFWKFMVAVAASGGLGAGAATLIETLIRSGM
jgi:hypothetical protein